MTNSQYIEQAKNFWADEGAFAEAPCVSCGEEECSIVNSLQEDGKWIAYMVEHDYKVTIDREGNWETTCEFSELSDAEKIFWNHTAKLYASVPLWMVEGYRGIDVDEAADSLYDDDDDDDDDEDDYSAWGFDEEDDDELEDEDEQDMDEILDDLTERAEALSTGAPKTSLKEESYISPFTGKV